MNLFDLLNQAPKHQQTYNPVFKLVKYRQHNRSSIYYDLNKRYLYRRFRHKRDNVAVYSSHSGRSMISVSLYQGVQNLLGLAAGDRVRVALSNNDKCLRIMKSKPDEKGYKLGRMQKNPNVLRFSFTRSYEHFSIPNRALRFENINKKSTYSELPRFPLRAPRAIDIFIPHYRECISIDLSTHVEPQLRT